MTYQSTLGSDAAQIQAAALYCSDGRVCEHFDDFLHNALGLRRYDRLCLPGGPACLAGHAQAGLDGRGILDELKFLVDVHRLSRIILIAHEGCAFYATRLELPASRAELVQRADLVRAASLIHQVTGLDAIEAYFARTRDGKMHFEPEQVERA